ncbi:MAG: transcriptional repressor [Patescibacteria group bacterium]|nr:transcriptional repressor [Patescibacteria group bacterium]
MPIQIKQHDCKTELREADLKATPARLAALKVLEASNKPLDVATIRLELKRSGINTDPATVFRMMNSFSDKGIVRGVNLQESKLRYEHAAKKEHHHLLCQSCSAIEDISDCNINALEKGIEKKKGFLVKSHALEFYGLCQKCQKIN